MTKTKRHFTNLLAEKFPRREAEQLMRILLEDLFGIGWNQQLMNPEMRIDEFQHARLRDAVERLLSGEPVQYVTGMARFCDLMIKVSPAVLIPRPETEELVQKICYSFPNINDSLLCQSPAAHVIPAEACAGAGNLWAAGCKEESIGGDPNSQKSPLRIWDIGTGSGCIAIALAKHFMDAEVIAFDVSEEALQIAKENAESNGVKVTFVQDDILNPQSDYFNQPFDLVVSNPPYVCDSERTAMEANVLDWEPESALFVPDDDPLRFYRKILELAKPQLNPDGQIWFEINERMGEEMIQLCHDMGFAKAEIIEDYKGKPRFCSIR